MSKFKATVSQQRFSFNQVYALNCRQSAYRDHKVPAVQRSWSESITELHVSSHRIVSSMVGRFTP